MAFEADATVQPGIGPGQDKCIAFTLQIAGETHSYRFRRPTRADVRDAVSRCTVKLLGTTGLDSEMHLNDDFDGGSRLWESRLEIGFLPRRRGTDTIDFGEMAPAHWFRAVLDAAGKPVDRVVTFDSIYPDEFDAVVKHIDAELKKKASEPGTSGSSVVVPSNA